MALPVAEFMERLEQAERDLREHRIKSMRYTPESESSAEELVIVDLAGTEEGFISIR